MKDFLAFIGQFHVWFTIVFGLALYFGVANMEQVMGLIKVIGEALGGLVSIG